MTDFITFMPLKYFNDAHTPKNAAIFALFLLTVMGKETDYLALSV